MTPNTSSSVAPERLVDSPSSPITFDKEGGSKLEGWGRLLYNGRLDVLIDLLRRSKGSYWTPQRKCSGVRVRTHKHNETAHIAPGRGGGLISRLQNIRGVFISMFVVTETIKKIKCGPVCNEGGAWLQENIPVENGIFKTRKKKALSLASEVCTWAATLWFNCTWKSHKMDLYIPYFQPKRPGGIFPNPCPSRKEPK